MIVLHPCHPAQPYVVASTNFMKAPVACIGQHTTACGFVRSQAGLQAHQPTNITCNRSLISAPQATPATQKYFIRMLALERIKSTANKAEQG
jgi:hypothetical protein